jgi:hypothetical protein
VAPPSLTLLWALKNPNSLNSCSVPKEILR